MTVLSPKNYSLQSYDKNVNKQKYFHNLYFFNIYSKKG